MHQAAKKLANTGRNELIHRSLLGCQRSFSVNVINQFHYLESFREDQELPERIKEGKEKLRSPFSPTAQWGGGTPAW